MTIAASWARIDAWLAREAAPVAASLGAAASVAALGAAPGLPASLRESMACHQGERDELCLFEGYALMTLDECLAARAGMMQLRTEFEAEYRAIGSEYWGPGWHPFMRDPSGSYLCVDAVSGAVISFVYNQPDRLVVAPDLASWLGAIADAMEAGECRVDDVGVWLRSQDHALARSLWGSG